MTDRNKCPRKGLVGNVFYHNVSPQIPDLPIDNWLPSEMYKRLHERGMLVWYWRNGPTRHRWIYGPEPRNPFTNRMVVGIPMFSKAAVEKLYRRWWHGWCRWTRHQIDTENALVDYPCHHGVQLRMAEDFRWALLSHLES